MRHDNASANSKTPGRPGAGIKRAAWLKMLVSGVVIAATFIPPRAGAAEPTLTIVDIVAVSHGYRASKLRGTDILGTDNKKIGSLDDLVIGRTDRVLFSIIQVGGLLGVGSHLIAVPYTSLQISDDGRRIVLPGATKSQVENLPEFKY